MKGSDKCMDGIELKFSDFFLKDDIQMWGCKPMLRILVNSLKKEQTRKYGFVVFLFRRGAT